MERESETHATLESSDSQVEIVLKYDGFEVDDGTMPIEDVISALRGFSNAYGRVASSEDPSHQHQIRVAAINRSSFAVSIIAWATEYKALLVGGVPIASAIVGIILKLIELKKATQGQPPASITIDGNNNTVIVTTAGDNTKIVIPRNVYEIYKSKELDGELSKIVSPLREGKVDAVSISARDNVSPISPVVITSSEKDFFRAGETKETTTSKSVEIDGSFVSLNKDTDRGRFRMPNGATVPYHFTGEDTANMHGDFAHPGPVRIQCIATFDGNLELKGLEISKVTRLQVELFQK